MVLRYVADGGADMGGAGGAMTVLKAHPSHRTPLGEAIGYGDRRWPIERMA